MCRLHLGCRAHACIPPVPCSPAGYYTYGKTACLACPSGTYRSGDAGPENHKCLTIPAGYKGNQLTAATDISRCPKGTVSYWNGTVRVPAQADICAACTGSTYAPREGMGNCLVCTGGTTPSKSAVDLLGPDKCSKCPANTYRSSSDTR